MADKIPKFEDTMPLDAEVPKFEDTVAVNETTIPYKDTKSVSKKADKLEALKAGLIGFKQGATFGFSDEIEGALSAGVKALNARLGNIYGNLTKEEQDYINSTDFETLYKEERDKLREEIKKANEEHPIATAAGDIVSFAVPGFAVAKVAKRLASSIKAVAKIKAAAKAMPKTTAISAGAGIGALEGAGRSEEESLEGVAKDAAQWAAIGAAVPGAGALMHGTGRLAFKAADNAQLRRLGFEPEKIKKLSDNRKEAILNTLNKGKIFSLNPQKTFENAVNLEQNALKSMKAVNEAVKNLPGAKAINKERLLSDFDEIIRQFDFEDLPAASRLSKQLRNEAGKLKENNFQDILDFYGRVGYHSKKAGDEKARIMADFAYKKISENIDDTLRATEKVLDNPRIRDTFRAAREEYGIAKEIAQSAKATAAKEDKTGVLKKLMTASVNPMNYFYLSTAMAHPAIPAAIMGVKAAKAVASKYGPRAHGKVRSLLKKEEQNASRKLIRKGETDKLLDYLKNN